jgi:hypothetical protein
MNRPSRRRCCTRRSRSLFPESASSGRASRGSSFWRIDRRTTPYTQKMSSPSRLLLIVALAIIVGALGTAAATGAARSPSSASHAEQTLPPTPPKPTVAATRVGKRVRISYSFAAWPTDADRRPVQLITAVQSSGTRYGPLHKEHRISARKGVVWQPLGLGSPPFKLYAASYSRLGRSSPTVLVRVRNG